MGIKLVSSQGSCGSKGNKMKIAKVGTKQKPKYDPSTEIYNVLPCTKETYEFIRNEFKNNLDTKDIDAVIRVDFDGNWMVGLTFKNKIAKKWHKIDAL